MLKRAHRYDISCVITSTSIILPAGRGPRIADAVSQGKLVKERLRRWRAGEYRQLWEEAKNLTKSSQTKSKKNKLKKAPNEKTQEEINAARAAIFTQDGQYTKALQALGSAGMADQDSSTANKLKQKQELLETKERSLEQMTIKTEQEEEE